MERSKMPKKRLSKNKGLPERWRMKGKAYYYRVPKGLEHMWDDKTEFKLGNSLSEAYKTWSERIEYTDSVKTVKQLAERYMAQVAPVKAARTYAGNLQQVEKIIAVFGEMKPCAIKPSHIYKYYDVREAKVAAKREIALFSHILTKAVEWGYINKHPFKGEVRLKSEKARDRYVEDWEIIKCLESDGSEIIKSFIRFAVLTGLRKKDALTLKVSDIKEDGLHVQTSKTGKKIIITWTEDLRDIVDDILEKRYVDISPWLFCKRDGGCYYDEAKGSSGWDTMWRRFLKRAGVQFTMHDLRAKCASDINDEKDAQRLLAHDSIKTTRGYRRKVEKVRPLR